jgi:hypothetical protein
MFQRRTTRQRTIRDNKQLSILWQFQRAAQEPQASTFTNSLDLYRRPRDSPLGHVARPVS